MINSGWCVPVDHISLFCTDSHTINSPQAFVLDVLRFHILYNQLFFVSLHI